MLCLKERIDILLVNKNLAPSREKAKALVMAGLVYAGEQRVDKAGTMLDEQSDITVRGGEEYVSRGGKKLAKAIAVFNIDLCGQVCADIGASTGGFTDCMLQNGALKVFAVDVGYGQLAWKLRADERVVNIERTNIRNITPEQLPELLDFFSVDVSFISLKLVLPAVAGYLSDNASGVCLIKPQFEAGREKIGKNGVVREATVHIEVIEKVFGYIESCGFGIKGLTFSPITGPKGNIEYLVYVSMHKTVTEIDIENTVAEAHKELLDAR